jgi:hypothetical protein
MTELWRRLILLAGVTLTVCMFLFADLSPRVSVESVDFKKEQKNQTRFMGFISEQRRYLASLSLKTYVQKMIEDREVEDGAVMKACLLTGKEIPRNSPSRKTGLVVMKIRTNQ